MSQSIPRQRRRPFAGPAPLTQIERKQFRLILENEVFRKALARVQNMKPSAFAAQSGPQGASDRLYEIRGWELFEHALYLQAESPKPRTERATETYPDQGLIDYEK